MNIQFYRKDGRKYIPVGYSNGFTGFPCEGLWAVYSKPGIKSEKCIASVGEIKPIDYSLMSSLIANKQDDCLNALKDLMKNPYSHTDIVNVIFETILKK